MALPSDSHSDSVDALLNGKSYGRDEQLHAAVLAQTTGMIRRRRHVRRVFLVAALVACYLAGVATMQLQRPGGPDHMSLAAEQSPSQEEQPPEIAPAPQPERIAMTRTDKKNERPRRRRELRTAGFDDIRRVSDRYLRENGDVALALRYYCRALDIASAEQRAISVGEDSWLLMALKNSRMEETENDNDS